MKKELIFKNLPFLLIFIFSILVLASRSTNYFVGDLSHLTLNSSYNLFQNGEYNYGNSKNYSTAVKNSPLFSIILSMVFKVVFSIYNLSPDNLVIVSIYVVNIIFVISVVIFFDLIKKFTNSVNAILITFLFFLNEGILNSLLKISSEIIGVFLLIAWLNSFIRFLDTKNINYYFLIILFNSLMFTSRYQLLIIHLYGIITIIYLSRKHRYNLFVALFPLYTLGLNFYFNYKVSSNILGHPSGVKGDALGDLTKRFLNLILNFFNYDILGNFVFIVLVILFIFTFKYVFNEQQKLETFFKNLYRPNFDFILFFVFFLGNMFLLIMTLNLNKADALSFRYAVYYFLFFAISLTFVSNKFKSIQVLIGVVVISNFLSIQATLKPGSYLDNCHCSDFSPTTIAYIEENLQFDNILGSRYLTQIWYSKYEGLMIGIPFYSDYNKAYERNLYLDEEKFLEIIKEKDIEYIVFFEGKDKVDRFATRNNYGDFIGSFYFEKSSYIKNIIQLDDGKVIQIKKNQ